VNLRSRRGAIAAAAAALAVGVALVILRGGNGRSLAGVDVVTSTVPTPAGPVRVVRVGIRLGDRRYRVVPIAARGRVPSELDAVVAMNADFYNLETHTPSGRLVIAGRDLPHGPSREPWLRLAPEPVEIGIGPTTAVDLVSGKPRLVARGRARARLRRDGATPLQLRTRAPRVAVALTSDWLWLVGVGPPGMTIREFQRLLVALHVRAALGFDGGPSADIAILGTPVLGQPEAAVPVDLAIVPAG
jgi:hypothetical protein